MCGNCFFVTRLESTSRALDSGLVFFLPCLNHNSHSSLCFNSLSYRMTFSEFDVLGFSNTKNIHLPYKILNTVDQGQKMPWQKSEMSFVSDVISEAYSIFKHVTH